MSKGRCRGNASLPVNLIRVEETVGVKLMGGRTDGRSDERMDKPVGIRTKGWTDGRAKGWANERTGGRTDGRRTDGWTNVRGAGEQQTDERTDERTKGRTNGRTDRGTDGGTGERRDGRRDERTDGRRTDGRTRGRTDGQMDGRTYDNGHGRMADRRKRMDGWTSDRQLDTQDRSKSTHFNVDSCFVKYVKIHTTPSYEYKLYSSKHYSHSQNDKGCE